MAAEGRGGHASLRRIPFRRAVPGLLNDPLRGFKRIGDLADGNIAQVNLGLFRPYLLTHPDHVQHVLRDSVTKYRREGMMWRPLRRLLGNGIASDGEQWRISRTLIQPLFTARRIANHLEVVADTIAEEVDRLAALEGKTIDANRAMTRILHRALVRAFFGGRINVRDADRLAHSIEVVQGAVALRMLLPVVPPDFPLPGDRRVREATKVADEIIFPLVRQYRAAGATGQREDLAALLCEARDENGKGLSDRRVRDDIVSIFAAGTETTSTALTWLWVVLGQNPSVAARLYEEVDEVIGDGPARPAHLPHLRYTHMVLQELLRLYPIAWVLPRTVMEDDTIDGIRIGRGSTVVMSPYLTHRRPDLWENPLVFDPERFAPERPERRHRYAYYPFGGGMHTCLGSHLFGQEAALAIGTILTRVRPRSLGKPPSPAAGAALRPSKPVRVKLMPRGRQPAVPSSR